MKVRRQQEAILQAYRPTVPKRLCGTICGTIGCHNHYVTLCYTRLYLQRLESERQNIRLGVKYGDGTIVCLQTPQEPPGIKQEVKQISVHPVGHVQDFCIEHYSGPSEVGVGCH
jgi:hypothetical protein